MDKVLFIDRDGTLVEEPPDEQVDALAKVRFVPDVISALGELSRAGYRLVLVSNQDGLGTESFPEADFRDAHDFILTTFASQGVLFEQEFICPHRPADDCRCRKPATGLVDEFLASNDIDRTNSFVIGDRATDLEFAANLGLAGFRLDRQTGWEEIAGQILRPKRSAEIVRRTSETDLRVAVHLDRDAEQDIDTGIAFFDHMLEQLALHGGFGLQLECRGDLEVDDHHTVEDVALGLGTALDQALGDRAGIGRYGYVLPMDESLAQVAIDLSGRPHCSFEASFGRPMIGQLATEMVPHFFNSLAQSLRASFHVTVSGANTHHQVEAAFKGLGRALRPALAVNGRVIPSSKGSL
ncbi:MAG: bifunctional histidinol-phosphatase/imidazoleglycerol-phosphate dehydratase HisB [Gammaproteobacteria bacterium]|nr:bifunctional histidinol-phosphatase/imidazoleglycerol-phosphate dehydratase HisB [Gammaproteobacteria bacterium]NNF62306.1 bifunctional histidinol-phosphatase/imidazoleglycerol-phosphate dehydratase HisB [Gammaproteobacteria bacterium]NNM21213.1 bifunctional histidinol-phosphatase/imidazoleglycerol-phosphate dehydratase HisB [Gammaproteobacteria bacterium]